MRSGIGVVEKLAALKKISASAARIIPKIFDPNSLIVASLDDRDRQSASSSFTRRDHARAGDLAEPAPDPSSAVPSPPAIKDARKIPTFAAAKSDSSGKVLGGDGERHGETDAAERPGAEHLAP
jgi:hypothetical protein